jgi:hypothetical protein
LACWAQTLARQPWVERIAVTLHDVVPVIPEAGGWVVRDASGQALPLEGAPHWTLLAHSGGHPVDLTAEWDGRALAPLGVFAGGEWRALTENG